MMMIWIVRRIEATVLRLRAFFVILAFRMAVVLHDLWNWGCIQGCRYATYVVVRCVSGSINWTSGLLDFSRIR
jgi:hypothetical protein